MRKPPKNGLIEHQNVPYSQFAVETAFSRFTRRYVMHARDLARSGQKDAARDWHRYFTNAEIVKHISAQNHAQPSTIEQLAQEITELGRECHPLDVADWATDIQAIRAALEKILENLPRKRQRTVNRSRSVFPTTPYAGLVSLRDRAMRKASSL